MVESTRTASRLMIVAKPNRSSSWRANLYVMDLGRDRQRAAAWSPLAVGDFHVPGRFGILLFEGPSDDMETLEPEEGPH